MVNFDLSHVMSHVTLARPLHHPDPAGAMASGNATLPYTQPEGMRHCHIPQPETLDK